MNIRRTFKYLYLRYRRLNGSPQSIALGSAIGVFMGLMPIMPLRSIAILLSTFIVKANTIAALIMATAISNPFTYLPLYLLAGIIGNKVTDYQLDLKRIKSLLNVLTSDAGFSTSLESVASLGVEAAIILFVGGITMALPISIFAYVIFLYSLTGKGCRRKRGEP